MAIDLSLIDTIGDGDDGNRPSETISFHLSTHTNPLEKKRGKEGSDFSQLMLLAQVME